MGTPESTNLTQSETIGEEMYKSIAEEQGIALEELLVLVDGRKCATYPEEPLFVLRGRGGKLQVRNVSKKFHIEKMQAARKAKKA